jgi:hypothetical protein
VAMLPIAGAARVTLAAACIRAAIKRLDADVPAGPATKSA